MIPTHDELVNLTGYKPHKKQAEWLAQNGIDYRLNANGHVVTTWNVIDACLMGKHVEDVQPNFDWTRG